MGKYEHEKFCCICAARISGATPSVSRFYAAFRFLGTLFRSDIRTLKSAQSRQMLFWTHALDICSALLHLLKTLALQVSEMIGAVAGSKGSITPLEFVFAFKEVFHCGRRAI